jgi:hypothetical protein
MKRFLAMWLLICAVALILGLVTVHERTQEQIEKVSIPTAEQR